ncbi:AMP-binding protein [Acanthopleuribacter pedis]|uniref:AMP-binding protein n=1 Tax=Acanthopleuribacter pedis TaxID=442870 RepID=A0A8J7QJH5_9BACT|nr:AMP-binding protein [Acanthopleuribacter pedis]MBO1319345.1 AMP-binding protein [Acanthopleuribacter pedis]
MVAELWTETSADAGVCSDWWRGRLALVPNGFDPARFIPRGRPGCRDYLGRGVASCQGEVPLLQRFSRYVASLALLWSRHSGCAVVVVQTPPLQQSLAAACGVCAAEPVVLVLEIDSTLTAVDFLESIQTQIETAYGHSNRGLAALLQKETGLTPPRLTPLLVVCPQLHGDPRIEPNLLIQIDLDHDDSIAYHANLLQADYDLKRLHTYWLAVYRDLVDAHVPPAGHLARAGAEPTWLGSTDPETACDDIRQDGLFTWFLDLDDLTQEQPGAPACALDPKITTYAALNDDVKRLSSYLQCELGLVPADPVLIYMNRSPEALAAMLAVIHAGGVVIPLDPAQNQARVADVLAEAKPRYAMTLAGDALDLRGFHGHYVLMDVVLPELPEVLTNVFPILPQEQAAFVFYGAGESDYPQGAVLSRGALYQYVQWANERYRLKDEACSFAWIHSFATPAGLTAVFCTLLQGGQLTIFPEHVTEAEMPAQLRGGFCPVNAIKLNRCRLDLLHQLEPEPTPLRVVVLDAGEVTTADAALLRRFAPDARYLREYGCCESGLAFAACDLDETSSEGEGLPLGRPLPGKRVTIVNQLGLPCPQGVAGEIWVAGHQLGAAYLARPELSNAAFHLDAVGTPVYRSREWGYWLEDGQVVRLGMMGRQFQMGDFRVQPGEIERVLADLEGVEEALVVVRQISSREPQMTAYVLGYHLDEAVLFDQLAERLPAFLIPNYIVPMVAWPLNANGTISYADLPEPEISHSDQYSRAFAPQTYREALLAGLFAKALGLPEVGVTDDFFQLGGDDHAAMDLLKTARALDFYFSYSDLMRSPRVRALAKVPDRVGEDVAQQTVHGALALLPSHVRFFAANPQEPDENVETMVLEVPEGIDARPLELAVERLLTMHDALRARFVGEGASRRAEIMPPAETPAFSVENLHRYDEDRQETRFETIHEQVAGGLCLDWGLLFHVCLCRMGGGLSDRLILVVHQLVVDDVSWRVLLSDLGELYRCFSANRDPYPLAKTDSLRAWSAALRQELQEGSSLSESRRWLEDSMAVEPVFSPLEEPYEIGYRDDHQLVLALDRPTSQTLLIAGRRVLGQRLYTLLLGGLACALRDFSGGEAVTVQLEGQGRRVNIGDLDVSRTVGHLTSHFPFCLVMPPKADELEVLALTGRNLQTVEHEGLGYDMVRYLGEDAPGSALFQQLPEAEIAFSYSGVIDEQPVPGWMTMEHRKWTEENLRRPLMIEGFLREGVLQFQFEWVPSRLEETTVINLAMSFLKYLGRLGEIIGERAQPNTQKSPNFMAVSDPHTTAEFFAGGMSDEDSPM